MKPQTVQIVRQGEATPYWFKFNPLYERSSENLLLWFSDDLSSFRPYESPKNALFDQTQMAFVI
mgnify:CR=1 FL=1